MLLVVGELRGLGLESSADQPFACTAVPALLLSSAASAAACAAAASTSRRGSAGRSLGCRPGPAGASLPRDCSASAAARSSAAMVRPSPPGLAAARSRSACPARASTLWLPARCSASRRPPLLLSSVAPPLPEKARGVSSGPMDGRFGGLPLRANFSACAQQAQQQARQVSRSCLTLTDTTGSSCCILKNPGPNKHCHGRPGASTRGCG